jgi:hypothetical protein
LSPNISENLSIKPIPQQGISPLKKDD